MGVAGADNESEDDMKWDMEGGSVVVSDRSWTITEWQERET